MFRNRLRDDAGLQGYPEVATRMQARARSMPGFIDFKLFEAADGERVAIIVFDTVEHQRAWREDPEHAEAQEEGRESFYSEYSISVCEEQHYATFWRGERAGAAGRSDGGR